MLYRHVLKTIEQNSLIDRGSTVIAAISGGADSVCLTDILYHIKEELGFTLECAHLNHNLRGDESDGDELFVKELCARYGLVLHTKSVDVMSLAKGRSLEEAARDARYRFFEEITNGKNAVIATAHTQNDNVETFFINLLRGSGTRGLSAIPQRRGNIIRPMLDIKRYDIILHLESAGLTYRTDSTNSDTAYLRNFIRHSIVPEFERRKDTDIYKAVSKAAANLMRDSEALDMLADRVRDMSVSNLSAQPDAVLFRVLSAKLSKQYALTLDSVHFESIKALLKKGHGRTQLRGEIYAAIRDGCLGFLRVLPKSDGIIKLSNGENVFNKKTILIKKTKEVYSTLTKATLNCDKISGNIYARTRRDGDIFISATRKCTKHLKKLLVNDKVPREIRDGLVIICDDNGVVFVEGYGADARAAARGDEENKICIEIQGEKNDA